MIQIRQLTASDTAVYRQTRLECLKDFPASFGSSYLEESKREQLFFEGVLAEKLAFPFIYGAFVDAKCIGLCGFVSESKRRTRHRGDIIQVYVSQDYQGLGISKKLLTEVINAAFALPQIEQITLGVVASNIAANRLYEGLGFMEYGYLNNYFKEENGYLDERLMVLTKERWQKS